MLFTVSTYPSDPQARVGLTKCMDALRSMQTVWPSAGRALELLRGSKVNADEPLQPELSNFPDRQKRAADPSFDTDNMLERSTLPAQRGSYITRPNPYRSSSYSDLQDGYLNGFNLNTATSSTSSLPYYPSNDRWPSSHGYNSAPFPGALSTSVLPQLYSTGLEDPSRYRNQQNPDSQAGNSSSRFPQYWNDLSTFPQLSSAFGGIPDNNATDPPSAYMPDQYNIYSKRFLLILFKYSHAGVVYR